MGHVPDSLCWDDATTTAAAAVCRTRFSDRWRRRDGLTGMMVEEAAGGQTLRGRDGVVDLRLGNVNVLRSKLRHLNLRNSKYSYINVSIIEKLFQLGTKKNIQIPEGILMENKKLRGPTRFYDAISATLIKLCLSIMPLKSWLIQKKHLCVVFISFRKSGENRGCETF